MTFPFEVCLSVSLEQEAEGKDGLGLLAQMDLLFWQCGKK